MPLFLISSRLTAEDLYLILHVNDDFVLALSPKCERHAVDVTVKQRADTSRFVFERPEILKLTTIPSLISTTEFSVPATRFGASVEGFRNGVVRSVHAAPVFQAVSATIQRGPRSSDENCQTKTQNLTPWLQSLTTIRF